MPDVPRDPRQLARDILAGRVKIEDLARERQMRAPGSSPPPAHRQIPLPRPAQNMPRPIQVQNPTPLPPARRLQQPVQRPAPMQRPVPLQRQTPQRPVPQRPSYTSSRPGYTSPTPPPQPVSSVNLEEITPIAPIRSGKNKGIRIKEMARSRHALRQGFILSEVLGKPLALRDE